MTEEATAVEEATATPIKKKNVYITQILGAVDVPGAAIKEKGAGNSTRWVFDLEAATGSRIEVYLLDPRNHKRRIQPDLMSYSLAALSGSFYDARPVAFYEPDKGVFVITSIRHPDRAGAGDSAIFACRVAIDVMHSATR